MRFLRHGLVLILWILSLASLVLPILGSLFGDNNAQLEIVTGLRFQFGIFVLAAFAFALLLRSHLLIFTTFPALLFHGSAILPYYFNSREYSGSDPLRVLSFNVLGSSTNYPAVVEYVKKERPSVAVFQEISNKWAEGLAPLDSIYKYHYRVSAIDGLVYSLYPIEDPEVVIIGKLRGYVRFRIDRGDKKVVIIAAHAYPQFPYGYQGFLWRNEQLTETLPAGVNQTPDEPTIVLGDLNATMWSPQFAELIRKTGLRNARKGFGIFPSCGAYLEYTSLWASPYDHCLVNRHVNVSRFWTGPNLKSDHYPILSELYLAE